MLKKIVFIILASIFTLYLFDLINFISISRGIEDLGACFPDFIVKYSNKIYSLTFFFFKLLSFAAIKLSIKKDLKAR